MNVKEFAKWLKTQDQEATIMCLVHNSSGSYYEQGGTCREEEFTTEHSEYTDFRGNPFVKPDAPHAECRFLLIGKKE